MTYFRSGRWSQSSAVESGEERLQVGACEGPFEGRCRPLVMDLKCEKALFEIGQRRKVIRGEDLSLNDREIDLHLIEPTGALQVRTSRLLDHGQLLRSMEHLPRRDGTDQEPDR